MAEPAVYGDEVLEIEPHGIEHIPASEKHGSPARAFTLWFAANLCSPEESDIAPAQDIQLENLPIHR